MIRMSLNYSDPIVIDWIKDPNTGEKVSLPVTNEQQVVVENRLVLDYIPDFFYKVTFVGAGSPTTELNINQNITTTSQYKVDYNNGFVYVHPDRDAQTLTMNYYKRGILYYPASRIYTAVDGQGNPSEILQDNEEQRIANENQRISNENQRQSDTAQAISDCEDATLNANTVADDLNHLDEYDPSTTYQSRNMVRYLGSSYMCIDNDTVGQLPTNETYWRLVAKGVVLKYKGVWNTTTNYEIEDVAFYENALYFAKLSSTNIPPSNATYWELYLSGIVNKIQIGTHVIEERNVDFQKTIKIQNTETGKEYTVLEIRSPDLDPQQSSIKFTMPNKSELADIISSNYDGVYYWTNDQATIETADGLVFQVTETEFDDGFKFRVHRLSPSATLHPIWFQFVDQNTTKTVMKVSNNDGLEIIKQNKATDILRIGLGENGVLQDRIINGNSSSNTNKRTCILYNCYVSNQSTNTYTRIDNDLDCYKLEIDGTPNFGGIKQYKVNAGSGTFTDSTWVQLGISEDIIVKNQNNQNATLRFINGLYSGTIA
jgi:hypothetical protein